jgi:hypothetical protein
MELLGHQGHVVALVYLESPCLILDCDIVCNECIGGCGGYPKTDRTGHNSAMYSEKSVTTNAAISEPEVDAPKEATCCSAELGLCRDGTLPTPCCAYGRKNATSFAATVIMDAGHPVLRHRQPLRLNRKRIRLCRNSLRSMSTAMGLSLCTLFRIVTL